MHILLFVTCYFVTCALNSTEIEMHHHQMFYMLDKDTENNILLNKVKCFNDYIENLERVLDDI